MTKFFFFNKASFQSLKPFDKIWLEEDISAELGKKKASLLLRRKRINKRYEMNSKYVVFSI